MQRQSSQLVVDLSALGLDEASQHRVLARVNAAVLAELVHLDLADFTIVAGPLGPGIAGMIFDRDFAAIRARVKALTAAPSVLRVDFGALGLDDATAGRVGAKVSSAVLSELAGVDLGSCTIAAGRLGPGVRGFVCARHLKDLAALEKTVEGLR